jgi:hypothetical protein
MMLVKNPILLMNGGRTDLPLLVLALPLHSQ